MQNNKAIPTLLLKPIPNHTTRSGMIAVFGTAITTEKNGLNTACSFGKVTNRIPIVIPKNADRQYPTNTKRRRTNVGESSHYGLPLYKWHV